MTTIPLSVFAPRVLADPAVPEGVDFSVAAAGIRYRDRTDLLLARFAPGSQVAGVFTRSRCASAPVEWCRAALAGGDGTARALVVNSGNANAFTGKAGAEAARRTALAVAGRLGCAPHSVFLASTGVIGEPLPHDRLVEALAAMPETGAASVQDAARAIMTTDAFPKLAERSARVDGVEVRLVGIAKGAGMIAPDMATMLAYVFTDAAIAAPVLQALLARAAGVTFNAITVDGDTSTSDSLMAVATGAARARGAGPVERLADPRLRGFGAAFTDLLRDLAQQVVRDGEGATKFVEITVSGARSTASARTIAMAIANSPLVKTAFAGEDANWGRIVMAVGKAGEPADRDRLRITFGDLEVARDGARAPGYDEGAASAYMKRPDLRIGVDVGVGRGRFTAWTCDLNRTYIAINGDYRS